MRQPSVAGAVLAGGRSRRMGAPKAALELAGRPLISHPLAAVADAGLEPLVVAKPDSTLPDLDCEVIREPPRPFHPLLGIVAALEAAGRPIVAVGCDMPFVPAALIAWLAGLEAEVAVPRIADRAQPLLARYAPSAVAPLRRAVAAGSPAAEAVAALDPRVPTEAEIARFGDPARIAFNVNDRAELERAAEIAAAAAAAAPPRRGLPGR